MNGPKGNDFLSRLRSRRASSTTSADGQGNADASPRGDAPGFIVPLDEHTLALPDRRPPP